ncbi:hypothetical protein D3C75_608780 [compost metagenome]
MRGKRLLTGVSVILVGISIVAGSASAAVTTFGKWPTRYKTMYIASSSIGSPWASGASTWYNSTNFKLSTTVGVGTSYYAYNVNEVGDWDGNTYISYSNGVITGMTLTLNTYNTQGSAYTSSILKGVTTHEIGHSLGLNDAPAMENSSVMSPYTFYSDEVTPLRSVTPSATDISVVNGLYPSFSSLTSGDNNEADPGAAPVEDGIYIHPSWAVYYEDEAALTEAADLVVRGEVAEERGSKYRKGDYQHYTTEVNVEVTEVLKGDHSAEEPIVVSQMGGTDGEVKVFSEDSTHLKTHQEVILFLRKNADGTYRPINEDDGIYIGEAGHFNNIKSEKSL